MYMYVYVLTIWNQILKGFEVHLQLYKWLYVLKKVGFGFKKN